MPSDSRSFSGILNLESYPLGFKIQEAFLGSRILNLIPLDSIIFFGILNLESWILSFWIQEIFLGSWILNLESYPVGNGGMGTKLQNKNVILDHQKNALSFRGHNVKQNTVNATKVASKVGLGGGGYHWSQPPVVRNSHAIFWLLAPSDWHRMSGPAPLHVCAVCGRWRNINPVCGLCRAARAFGSIAFDPRLTEAGVLPILDILDRTVGEVRLTVLLKIL